MATPTPLPNGSVNKHSRHFAASTQRYLPIAEIKEDTVMLKNGGLRAVIAVNAMNFNLKSETEQEGIISGYGSFMNTLTFPIQIMVRSARLNIDPYIADLREMGEKQTNMLLKKQTTDYASFVERLINVADIMQKKFYLVVPIDGYTQSKKGLMSKFLEWINVDDTKAKAIQRSHEFNGLSKLLRERVLLVQSGLENIGITSKRLSTTELVQLYYNIYNPQSSQKQKLDALDPLNIDKSVL